jgi:glucose/arabinose dehydrogenase
MRVLGTWFARFAAAMALSAASASADMLATEPVAGGLSRVVGITNAGDGTGRLFFVCQSGQVRLHDDGALLPDPFLDVTALVQSSGYEEGLLSIAFHPQYRSNRRFFVYYTNLAGDNVLASYRASTADPNRADPASASILFVQAHPQTSNHNGGSLAFGPDGYLYVGLGDGGVVSSMAQDLGTFLGKILRLDVDAQAPYAIPADNPFVSTPGARREIWALGLRNPWRLTFDRASGDLWIGDVGELSQDEIDYQPGGAPGGRNYGWPIMEGSACHQTGCSPAGLTLPVLTHGASMVVAGGYRYRATGLPLLEGFYLYGSWINGSIWGARPRPDGTWENMPLLPSGTGGHISTFGEDESGDLYVADYDYDPAVGGVHRLVAADTPPQVEVDLYTDVTFVNEGAALSFDVVLSAARLTQMVTVAMAATSGTAESGADFQATAGTITFAPGQYRRTVAVPTFDDALDEEDLEGLTFGIASPVNAVLGPAVSDPATIVDDDPPPGVRVDDASAPEGGPEPSSACAFAVSLDAPSGREVRFVFELEDGTATAGSDYQSVGQGAVTFPPGVTSLAYSVPLVSDGVPEDNETFRMRTHSVWNGYALTGAAWCTIVDDDALTIPGHEIAHGSVLHGDLTGGADGFRLLQAPRSSYEVVVDATSGDTTPGLGVLRASSDNATILQAGDVVGTGSAVSLRWQNTSNAAIANQPIRVRSGQCIPDCGADDGYRARVYETTYRAARFNNTGGQGTVLIVQNPTASPVQATAWFWDAEGAPLHRLGLALPARGSVVRSLGAEPALAGRQGSVTLSHDAPYGALVGKTVGLDPTGGFAFDTPIEPRPR